MEISTDLFQKYNLPVPRYTSYPPATSFHTAFTNEDYIKQIQLSNADNPQNISVYIHIPFCTQRCHFCGCNTVISQSEDRIERYVNAVVAEIKNTAKYIDKKRFITQISWGGGTPNSIDLHYVEKIMQTLRSEFKIADFAEIAMECSPAYLDFQDVDFLYQLGFNRISLGIQDFHQHVLDAINRRAPKRDVAEMLHYMRLKGFKGLNLDLVYGLPLQTIESYSENIDRIIELKPDRLATFSYAHIPWFNEAQKLMEHYVFPSPEQKLEMLALSINKLSENGYEVIGMDHFALKNDDLAIAKNTGQLHRNFQGYNTLKTTGQVYAFGASGISQLHGAYVQNMKQFDNYSEAIETDGFAVERGYMLADNEKIIRDTINQIMCNGVLDFEKMASVHSITLEKFLEITKFDVTRLEMMLSDGLVELKDNILTVSEQGMMVVRNVAVAFDPEYKPVTNKFSTTL